MWMRRPRRRPKKHLGIIETGEALCGAAISHVLSDEEKPLYRQCRKCERVLRVIKQRAEIGRRVDEYIGSKYGSEEDRHVRDR